MALETDPYRILGLTRGASLDDVKRAYRRLAKVNHPDAAGIGALPRFLAIQAAYEQLAGSARGPGAKPRGAASSPPRRPSEADQERADATRRAYGGRPRGRSGPTPDDRTRPGSSEGTAQGAAEPVAGAGRAGPRPSSRRPAGGRANDDGSASRPPAGGGARGRPASGTSGRRGKATLGSTSYDGADAGQFEPDWGGASWYGTTSGTYWTINPKEYADPRKHGPEYQARARRASTARPGPGAEPDEPPRTLGGDPEASESPEATTSSGGPRAGHEPAGAPGGASGATHTTASWWNSTVGPAAGGARPRTVEPGAGAAPDPPVRDASSVPRGPDTDPARAAADLAQALTDPRFGGLRARIVRAFVGWVPIALGLGWLFGELSGCGRFAATCDGSVGPLILVIQGAALAGLVLLPAAASLAATAALALLVAAVVATLVLSSTGSAADEASRRATLGVLLLAAWMAGLVIAVARRLRSVSAGVGPVS